MTVALPLAEWQRLGVRALGGGTLPNATVSGALVSGSTRHFLVYENYDALLQQLRACLCAERRVARRPARCPTEHHGASKVSDETAPAKTASRAPLTIAVNGHRRGSGALMLA